MRKLPIILIGIMAKRVDSLNNNPMTLYTPDWDYDKGEKMLKELKGIEGDMIRHYVEKNEKYTQSLKKQIDEMQEVFNGIRKYTKY